MHLVLLLLLGAPLLPTLPTGAQQVVECLPDTSGFGANLVRYMRILGAGTDARSVEARNRYSLPAVRANEVALVTDSAVCAAASAAYGHRQQEHGLAVPQAMQVIVVRVGATRYVVHDGGATRQGSYDTYLVMDSTYRVLSAFAS